MERFKSHWWEAHWILYAVTFTVIMLGWAHSGARTQSYSHWFGLFPRAADHLARSGSGAGV